jgi:hypothetical protein
MSTLFFCVVTPCGLAGTYQRFGEIYVSTFRDEMLVSTYKSTRRYNPEDLTEIVGVSNPPKARTWNNNNRL